MKHSNAVVCNGHMPWMISRMAPTVMTVFLLLGCSAASTSTAAQDKSAAQVTGTPATPSQRPGQSNDCLSIGTWNEREECLALAKDFDCSASDLRCAPYKQMYFEDANLKQVEGRLEGLARKTYADAGYASDLVNALHAAGRSWRHYRDEHCLMEPYTQGMSRQEAGDLTEVCRLSKTKSRIAELEALINAMD